MTEWIMIAGLFVGLTVFLISIFPGAHRARAKPGDEHEDLGSMNLRRRWRKEGAVVIAATKIVVPALGNVVVELVRHMAVFVSSVNP
jgi:hypothetical protein